MKCAVFIIAIFWVTNSDADAATKLNDIKSIAIISAIGDSITFARVGSLDFHAGAQSLSISNWNVDDQVEQDVAKKLGNRFKIIHVAYDRPSFAQEVVHTLTLEEPPIRDLVSRLSAPVDAYLVISKRGTNSTHEYLNLTGGINVLEQTSMFRKPVYALCVLIEIQLIDSKTNETVARDEIVIKPGVRYDDPANQLDPSLWPADGTHLTEFQSSELRKQATGKLILAIDNSLTAMGLQ